MEKVSNKTCTLCKNVKQTQRHVISCCPKALEDGRYTWRYNSVLYTLCPHLSVAVNCDDDELYADFIGFQTPTVLFGQRRPDACIVTSKGIIYAIELPVCYENNTTKAREYKAQRYRNLKDKIEIEYSVFKVVFIKITTLGLTPKTTIECKKLLKQSKVDYDRLFSKCCEVTIRTSYYIFSRRNKEWTHPLPLQYTT